MSEDLQKQFEEQVRKTKALDAKLDEQGVRIAHLERKLVQQEHRLVRIITNLFQAFSKDGTQDMKFASVEAAASFFGKWYFRRAAVIGGVSLLGGLLAAGTLFVAWSQTQQLVEQNTHMVQQNNYMRTQMIDQQRSTNAEILNTLLVEIGTAAKTAERDSAGRWPPPNLLAHQIYRASLAFEPFGDDSLSSERGQLLEAMVADGMIVPKWPNPNFYRARLLGANLGGADLGGANLRNVDLRGANLRNADLGGADLYLADLGGADLRNAKLDGASLRDADLRNAKLQEAFFHEAELRNANLDFANLSTTDLRNVNLRGADLLNTDLSRTNLFHADLGDSEGLTIEQLLSTYWLYKTEGINDSLLNIIKKRKPTLLDSIPPGLR